MSSSNEQDNLIDPGDSRELQLLSEVDRDPDATQRQLSKRVGIALGLTNILLRNLTQKGYVRVSQATWRRRLYTLTPEGFSRRIRLMVSYIHRVLDHYQRIRHALRQQLEPLALHEESRVAIYGTGEFAELVYLGLREIGIEEIDIYGPSNGAGEKFLGMPVRQVATFQAEEYDRVVIALLGGSDDGWVEFQELGAAPENLVTFFADGKAREVG